MKNKDFNNLMQGVKELNAYKHGRLKTCRVFAVDKSLPAFRIRRIPIHPGHVLKEEFLIPLGLRQCALAKEMNISSKRVSELVNGKRSVTPEIAVLLSKALKTSAEFWMNLQTACDLANAKAELDRKDEFYQ